MIKGLKHPAGNDPSSFWLHVVAATSLSLALNVACGALPLEPQVDAQRTTAPALQPELVIGPLQLSARRIDKNIRRIAGLPGNSPATPSPGAANQALERFLVEQVLTAMALREGYGVRPEVEKLTALMERYKLTAFNGPLYQAITGTAATAISSPLESEREHLVYDAALLRFHDTAPIATGFGRDFTDKTAAEQNRLIDVAKGSGQARFFEGEISKPFQGFEDAGPQLDSAPLDRWTLLRTQSGEVYLLKVRGKRIAKTDQDMPPPLAENLRRWPLISEHRNRVLEQAQMSYEWERLAEMIRQLAQARPSENTLPAHLMADQKDRALATYVFGDTQRTVYADDFIRSFNEQFIRRLPVNAFELADMLRSLVIEEFDFKAADERGFRDRPEFKDDLENFRCYQALDLFEKERIRPMLEITDAAVAGEYRQRLPEFTVAGEIAGTLFHFDRLKTAADFARASVAAGDSGAKAPPPPGTIGVESLVVTRTTGLPGWKGPPQLVHMINGPRILGPYPHDQQFLVWRREQVSQTEPLPLADVAAEIRAQLERKALLPLEARLAREWSGTLTVQDHIDYAAHGAAGPLPKPW